MTVFLVQTAADPSPRSEHRGYGSDMEVDAARLAVSAVLSVLPTIDMAIDLVFACIQFLLHYDVLNDAGDLTTRRVAATAAYILRLNIQQILLVCYSRINHTSTITATSAIDLSARAYI